MRALLFLCASLLFAAACQARMNVAPSIEWLADRSEAIGIYSVETVRVTSTPQAHDPDKGQYGRWGIASVTLKLLSTKKGSPPDQLETEYLIAPTDSAEDIRRQIAPEQHLACFLWQEGGSEPLALHRLCNLSSPSHYSHYAAFSSDFRVLELGADILSALDARLRHPGAARIVDEHMAAGVAPPSWIEVPMDAPAFRALYGGSTCYLLIPEGLRPQPSPNHALQRTEAGH